MLKNQCKHQFKNKFKMTEFLFEVKEFLFFLINFLTS